VASKRSIHESEGGDEPPPPGKKPPPPKKKMKQGNLLQFGNRILPEGETVMMTSTRVMRTRRVRLPFGCCASKLCLRCTLMMHSGLMKGGAREGL